MFVTPDVQRQGIGRRLLGTVEVAARRAGIDVLAIPSSVTAEQFYANLGYRVVRDSFHGEERTIIMERTLTKPKAPQPDVASMGADALIDDIGDFKLLLDRP